MSIFFARSKQGIYTDTELNKVPQILFNNGVFNTKSGTHKQWREAGDFLVEADSSTLNVTARAGAATVLATLGGKAQRLIIQEDVALTAAISNNQTLPVRNDAVVLRVNQSILTNDELNPERSNAVTLVAISGSSANPLTDQEISVALMGDPFVRLADILVPGGATAITPTMITDRRTMVKMTRSAKLASDSVQLYALPEDPKNPEVGDMWFNAEQETIKFFDGENTISLQSAVSKYGYYPEGGVIGGAVGLEPKIKNDSIINQTSVGATRSTDSFTVMIGQVFVMPQGVTRPNIRLRVAPEQSVSGWSRGSVYFYIYTADLEGRPVSLVERTRAYSPTELPFNADVDIRFSENYNPGQTYVFVIGQVTGSSLQGYFMDFRTSYNEDAEGYVGIKLGNINQSIVNPLDMNWLPGYLNNGSRHLISGVYDISSLEIGEENTAGNNYLLGQSFVAESPSIETFRVFKDPNIGTPTGGVKASLYRADAEGRPIGDVFVTAEITNEEWLEGEAGDPKNFKLNFSELVIGNRYVVVLDTDNNSNSNNYIIWVGSSGSSTLKRFTTAEGWVDMDVEIIYEIITSRSDKLVLTNSDGYIPPELIDYNLLAGALPLKSYTRVSFSNNQNGFTHAQASGDYLIITGNGSASNSYYATLFKHVDGVLVNVGTIRLDGFGIARGWGVVLDAENKHAYFFSSSNCIRMDIDTSTAALENPVTITGMQNSQFGWCLNGILYLDTNSNDANSTIRRFEIDGENLISLSSSTRGFSKQTQDTRTAVGSDGTFLLTGSTSNFFYMEYPNFPINDPKQVRYGTATSNSNLTMLIDGVPFRGSVDTTNFYIEMFPYPPILPDEL